MASKQQDAGKGRLRVNSDSDYNSFSPTPRPPHGPETSGGALLDVSTSSATSGASTASAIERSPEAEYQSAFEQLGFTSTVSRELVERFVLMDGHPEWPHVAPYECAIYAIESRAAKLQHLESIPSITALASDIAQYGFVADKCETFAQRIVGSGAPYDQTLPEWLSNFIECSVRCHRNPKPDGVPYEKAVPIEKCVSRNARQMWLEPNGSEQVWKDRIHKTLQQFNTDSNRNPFFLFHATEQEFADAIAADGIQPQLGKPKKDFSHGLAPPRNINRGGFYLSRFLPAALDWAWYRHQEEPALLVYLVDPLVFTAPAVSTYDFFVNGTEAHWQATIKYYKSGCRDTKPQLHEAEGAAAAAENELDVDSFHCLVGPRSDDSLVAAPDGTRRWKGWRKRATYTGRALHDAFVRQEGYNVHDNNEQYCVRAPIGSAHPTGDMSLAQRLDSCLVLVVYL